MRNFARECLALTAVIAIAAACGVDADSTANTVAFERRPVASGCHVPDRPPDRFAAHRFREDVSFYQPSNLVLTPDGSGFFVIERAGIVSVLPKDPTIPVSVFADFRSVVDTTSFEDGFLSIAASPDFAATHEVFFSYTTTDSRGFRFVIARAQTDQTGATLDIGTYEEVLSLPKAEHVHHGGRLLFGTDRMLYVGIGDGNFGDPHHYAQDPNEIYGKFIRIDVLRGNPYAIPEDNPFVLSGDGRGEIWAIGFRNPWGFSFDRLTGQLWAGDVGQFEREEVDVVVGGRNYGWSIQEGTGCYAATTCETTGLVDPVYEYVHPEGYAVTGGYVYRGKALPSLYGTYVFGDWGTGMISGLTKNTAGGYDATALTDSGRNISAFAEDSDGELYFTDFGGGIYRLDAATPETFPSLLSQTGCVAMGSVAPPEGAVPYDVNMELWSDGADKRRWFSLPESANIKWYPDNHWEFPLGTILVKTFLLRGKPVETRLLVNHVNGAWTGYSYAWDADGREAQLLSGEKEEFGGDQPWTFPSRAQCNACHNPSTNHALGLQPEQLNRQFLYPNGARANQLDALRAAGLFDGAPTSPAATLPRLAARVDKDSDSWAHAYLASNCAHCHHAGGPTLQSFDVSVGAVPSNLCAPPGAGSFGLSDPSVVFPGDPERSVLLARASAVGPGQMPPLGRSTVDTLAIGRLRRWITDLKSCPQ